MQGGRERQACSTSVWPASTLCRAVPDPINQQARAKPALNLCSAHCNVHRSSPCRRTLDRRSRARRTRRRSRPASPRCSCCRSRWRRRWPTASTGARMGTLCLCSMWEEARLISGALGMWGPGASAVWQWHSDGGGCRRCDGARSGAALHACLTGSLVLPLPRSAASCRHSRASWKCWAPQVGAGRAGVWGEWHAGKRAQARGK